MPSSDFYEKILREFGGIDTEDTLIERLMREKVRRESFYSSATYNVNSDRVPKRIATNMKKKAEEIFSTLDKHITIHISKNEGIHLIHVEALSEIGEIIAKQLNKEIHT